VSYSFEFKVDEEIVLVPTPHGWRPKQCVFKWPSGAIIRELKNRNITEVTLPDGDVVHLPRLPECMRDYFAPNRSTTRIQDGWLDNTGYYTNKEGDSTADVYQFSGTYTVPTTPTTKGGLLYYFIGCENSASSSSLGLTILQPVLTYYTSGWYMNSWNCCPNGQSHESATLSGFGPGNQVFGNIYESGSDYTIVSEWNNQQVTLTVADAGRQFVWIDATLETYYVTDCSQLSSGLMTYSAMALTTKDNQGNTANPTIQWINYSPTSACSGVTTVVSPTQVTIKHN